MTTERNVLAVMDDEIASLPRMAEMASVGGVECDPSEAIRRMAEARAAVAKLVEAARMANGDHTAPHDCYATGPLTGDPLTDLVVCPGCRLAAALRPFTGEQA